MPFPYLSETAVALAGSDVRWGAQDCSAFEQGAYTGEVSVPMLAEFGCRYVIVGHSERRAYHAESDQLVADKAKAALAKGEMVVAYEPVWAIGTGKVASPEQAQAVHAVLRAQLRAAAANADAMTILYGGSVKPDNAAILFGQTDIDGGLIGGAALKATDFVAICRAAG